MGGAVLMVHFTPPGVVGGVEHIIKQHQELLRAAGFAVEVVAGRWAPSSVPLYVIPEIDVAGVTASQVEDDLARGEVPKGFWVLRESILQQLAPLAARADTIIVHNAFTLHFSLPLTSVLWELANERALGSVLAWCHDLSWSNPLYRPAMHKGLPWDLLRTPAPNTHYVTISEERKEELLALWNGKAAPLTVIPNGIDVRDFLRLSIPTWDIVERYRLLDRDLVLLLPVRITRRKNIEVGIRAIRALKDKGLDVCFLISGPEAPHHPGRSRTYLAELEKLCVELGVDETVIFLAAVYGGNLDIRTVSELYTVADALLFPSESEGFGLPILEAALTHLPVVLSDIPIFHEIAGDAAHYFSPDDSGERVAAAVLAAVDGNASRLYRRVLHHYRWNAILEQQLMPLLERDQTVAASSEEGATKE